MTRPKSTPVDPGLIARIGAGLRYAATGQVPGGWFGPGTPLVPMAEPVPVGRQFDYPVGWNLRIRPRQDEALDFGDLRALAERWDLLRLVIETRKDQFAALDWVVRPRVARRIEQLVSRVVDRGHALQDLLIGGLRCNRGPSVVAQHPLDRRAIDYFQRPELPGPVAP